MLLWHFAKLLEKPVLHWFCIWKLLNFLFKLSQHSLPNLNKCFVSQYERLNKIIAGTPPGEPGILNGDCWYFGDIPGNQITSSKIFELLLVSVDLIILNLGYIFVHPFDHPLHRLFIEREYFIWSRFESLEFIQHVVAKQVIYYDYVHSKTNQIEFKWDLFSCFV